MPINENGEELCTFLVEGYGVCSRTSGHIVHQPMGISPVEHKFQPEVDENAEETRLSEESIPYISRRSGISEDDLRVMLMAANAKGRIITVRYKVKGE